MTITDTYVIRVIDRDGGARRRAKFTAKSVARQPEAQNSRAGCPFARLTGSSSLRAAYIQLKEVRASETGAWHNLLRCSSCVKVQDGAEALVIANM